jgi:pilus assembly protein CpaE
MGKISFVIYEDDAVGTARLASSIEQTSSGRVVGRASHEVALKDALAEKRPDVVLVDLDSDPHATLDMVENVISHGITLYVTGPQDDSALLLRALKLGVKEFFQPDPSVLELDAAIEELVRSRPSDRERGEAPILAVMGAKGGVGATFVACQLAASLQRQGGSAAIVDLNCPLGDVALQLDLEPRYTLASVLQQTEKCDATFLEQLLEKHPSGLQVLAAPERVEENELVRGDHVDEVLSVLRREVDWIVVDVARSWNEASVRALDLASEIVLVTSADLAALAHTRQHADLLERLGHTREKIHLVANRCSDRNAFSHEDLAKFLGEACEIDLPNDYLSAVEAVNSGQALADSAPRAELTLAIAKLAEAAHGWCGIEARGTSNPTRGLGSRVRHFFRR